METTLSMCLHASVCVLPTAHRPRVGILCHALASPHGSHPVAGLRTRMGEAFGVAGQPHLIAECWFGVAEQLPAATHPWRQQRTQTDVLAPTGAVSASEPINGSSVSQRSLKFLKGQEGTKGQGWHKGELGWGLTPLSPSYRAKMARSRRLAQTVRGELQ